jgi:glucan phosphoethanolaminetransferase (alkaline phosphatase superfamily)
MQSDTHPRAKHAWWKDILIGLLSWLVAFILYMLPSLAVGISMGVDLGPKLNDVAEVSRRISQTIGEMYQSGWYLHLGFIIVLGCIVFWRASVRTKQIAEKSILHGVTIGTTAAMLVIIQMMSHGVGVYMVIGALVCVVAGAVGGQQRKVSRIAE